jgi:small-conductance mechanosensitive channel
MFEPPVDVSYLQMFRSKERESCPVNPFRTNRKTTSVREYADEARRYRGVWLRPLVRFLVPLTILPALTPSTSGGQSNPPADPTPSQIVQFLSQTIDWYRQTQQEQHIATQPGDLGFVADNRRMAAQVVRLAFDFARAEEQKQTKPSKANPAATPNANLSQYESLSRAAARADQLVQETQTELESLQHSLETTPVAKRRHLQTQIAELQSELGLFQARQQALHGMLDFASGASGAGGTTSLRGQIEELARAVPPAVSGAAGNEPGTPAEQEPTVKTGDSGNKPSEGGMWALIADLFRLSSKRSFLSNDLRVTEALESSSKQLRSPFSAHLKQLIQSGDQLAKEADTSDQAGLAQQKQQLDALTAEFKQVSALLVSLRKQTILLDLYERSLSNWKAEVSSELKQSAKELLVRLIGLLIALGAVLIIGEVWRRAIFRYVHDVRRRYQFLLMRKIAIWGGVALVLIVAFVTELGAVATFAGLITAGVALALQNVIVSMVGYFFLIGKYGIRVGDRVQVGTVTGEVVDIGLVRFHLMELSGGTADSEPTGRVVAFSNAVVFQATAGLFKQIPGTNFIWRDIVLKFAPESDYRVIRDRVREAIDNAFADYRDSLERQRRQMEMSLTSVSASELKPRASIQFMPSAIQVLIRYPVVLEKATEIDERVIGDIFAAVDREPKLKLINSEIPTMKAGA